MLCRVWEGFSLGSGSAAGCHRWGEGEEISTGVGCSRVVQVAPVLLALHFDGEVVSARARVHGGVIDSGERLYGEKLWDVDDASQ